MQYLREKVSGKKNRLVTDGYNLDLTYITPRIIAMSLPGEGFTGFYRNPIGQVSNFLNKAHGDDYEVYNLCGKKYDTTKFRGRIKEYSNWLDHHSPPLDLLFIICNQIHLFLKCDISTVVVIHCLAGKGRTGTVICCYLLYSGIFDTVEQAMNYYGGKRFQVAGLGVNQPCQIRYIQYFYRLLKGEKLYPSIFWIEDIRFKGRPRMNMDQGCRPYLEIVNVTNQEKIYNQKECKSDIRKFTEGDNFTIKPDMPLKIVGDYLFSFRNIGLLKEEKICRISINTAFLMTENEIQSKKKNIKVMFNPEEIDPSQLATDQRFPSGFQIEMNLSLACKCTPNLNFEQRCEDCKILLNEEKDKYRIIYDIIERYQKPTIEISRYFLFGNKEDDTAQPRAKNKTISFNLEDEKAELNSQEDQKQTQN